MLIVIIKLQRRALVLTASLLAALLFATPTLPGLHRALATHAHVFCAQHQVYEDVPLQVQESPSTEPGRDGAAKSRSGHFDHSHVACAFLNLTLSSFEPVAAAPPGFARGASRGALGHRLPGSFAPIAALELAPKHSPPAAA